LADDLVERTRHELEERIAELETMTAELPRLRAALIALGGPREAPRKRKSPPRVPRNGGTRRRRPRGANRDAILKVIGDRPGASVGEVAAAVEKLGVKKNVAYATVNKLAKDGAVAKKDGSLTLIGTGSAP
jgi:hypothetical protein